MNLHTMPGYVLVRNPREHTNNGSVGHYIGDVIEGVCVPNENGVEALYHIHNGGRVFELGGVIYHSVPIANVFCYWEIEPKEME